MKQYTTQEAYKILKEHEMSTKGMPVILLEKIDRDVCWYGEQSYDHRNKYGLYYTHENLMHLKDLMDNGFIMEINKEGNITLVNPKPKSNINFKKMLAEKGIYR